MRLGIEDASVNASRRNPQAANLNLRYPWPTARAVSDHFVQIVMSAWQVTNFGGRTIRHGVRCVGRAGPINGRAAQREPPRAAQAAWKTTAVEQTYKTPMRIGTQGARFNASRRNPQSANLNARYLWPNGPRRV